MVILRKLFVSIISFLFFVIYLMVLNEMKNKESDIALYVLVLALIMFVIYGGLWSFIADKVAEGWEGGFWLGSLILHLLGGLIFPFVLSFVINPTQTIEQPHIGYDTGILPLSLIWSVVYWFVNMLLAPFFNKT